jgi:hypothetical protein
MDKPDIIIYVNNNGIIRNPLKLEDIEKGEDERIIIAIEITQNVRDLLNHKISFCDLFGSDLTMSNLSWIPYLKIIDNVGIQVIKDKFFSDCNELIDIDLSGLSNVTLIENGFLLECLNLTNINISQFKNVTKIGDWFLAGCRRLNNIDLSVFSNVKQIGKGFLAGCRGLTNIDLSGLSNVTQIEDDFLSDCVSLTNIDIFPLKNVTEIGAEFLNNCQSLQKIKILPHQQPILLKHNPELQSKLEINTEWYNTPEGQFWISDIMQKSNKIQNSDILLAIINYL